MAEKILSGKIKQLVYTTEELSKTPLSNTIIDNGVLVYEKTSSGQIKCKMGDGVNVWSGLNYIEDSDKMDKNNPTGTGSLSMNRAEGTTVGKNSVTLGTDCIASGHNAYAEGWNTFAARYKRYNITSIVETTVDDTIVHTLNIENSTSGWNGLDSYIYLQGYDNNNNKNVIFKTKIIYCYEATDDNGITYYQIRVDESNINVFSKDDITNTNYYNIFVDCNNDYDYILMCPHAEGNYTIASGDDSHAEGYCTTASSDNSHAEGYYTTVSGDNSHAEGKSTTASGVNSHAEGYGSNANGNNSHAEGYKTTVSGAYGCHAEGHSTTASGNRGSHAEGYKTTASGAYGCHAEGHSTTASGKSSHVEGRYTIASSDNQHVQGKYNIEDSSSTYAHIVGGGTSDTDRKNIHTLDWNGNAVFSGDVTATTSDGTLISLLDLYNTVQGLLK